MILPEHVAASLRQRLQVDLDALEASERALADVQIAQRSMVARVQFAEATLEQAQAALRAARAEQGFTDAQAAQILARCDALRALTRGSRAMLQTMATFPLDILSLVFKEACAVRTDNQDIDGNAIVLPYALAGVSKHWRCAAMNTHAIWRYIAIPPHVPVALDAQPFIAHVDDLIGRSGALGLDILIRAQTPGHLGDELDIQTQRQRQSSFFLQLFSRLCSVVSRLRSFQVTRSRDVELDNLRGNVLNLLRHPTPQLEELFVDLPVIETSDSEVWLGFPGKALPRFLPDATALRRLSVFEAPIVYYRPHAVISSLTSLSLCHNSMFEEHLWDMLSLVPNLRHLSLNLCYTQNYAAGPVNRPESMPITSLILRQSAAFRAICLPTQIAMPNLTSLDVQDWAFNTLIVTDSLARSVTTVTIRFLGDDEATRMAQFGTLRELRAVQSATLYYEPEDVEDAPGNDEQILFDALCSSDDPMWPMLRSLSVFGLDSKDGPDVERDGMLRLLRARNQALGTSSSDAPLTARIESVEFDAESVPPWVAAQVRAMLD